MESYLVQPDLTTNPKSDVFDSSKIPFTFELDPFQKHSISAIQQEHNVLVCAKTGSGKTLVGEYQIYYSLSKSKRIFYTTPIKSLSNQKFYDLVHQYPDASVGIMTGDIKFRPDAQIIVMTTEILRNLLYKRGTQTEKLGLTASLSLENLDAVIFDECHYINDPDRGKVWEETMILLPEDVKLIMLSATLDHPELFADWLGSLKSRPIHLIQTSYRIVPLTHTILNNNKFEPIMDAKELFYDKVYNDWLKQRDQSAKDYKQFQQTVRNAKQSGHEGPIEGKTRPKDFVHILNDTIELLKTTNQLPALFFVLSRKQCEQYAHKVSHTLLDSSETASVNHIISFHLSRYKSLETLPQYHQLRDLLLRGIAFHHSGLLPLLKEIVEILFTKGFVRVLFATETFAVGLNMPTKTVVFTGLKKYDEQTGGMRLLRTDEYIQMAGRAGRRGKDKQGLVVYLPDREPVDLSELRQIMKGTKTPIKSRMDFHYDFLLKTLQSNSLKWLSIMEKSYWFRQRERQVSNTKHDIEELTKKIVTIESITSQDMLKAIQERHEIELAIKTLTNAKKKDAQRKLTQWDNSHAGPKWVLALKSFEQWVKAKETLQHTEKDLYELLQHKQSLEPVIEFLIKINFLKNNDKTADELTSEDLTLRGVLATEINEGHPILMTELYLSEKAHILSAEDLIGLLAVFIEISEKDAEKGVRSLGELSASSELKDVLHWLNQESVRFASAEDSLSAILSPDSYWSLSLYWIEPIMRWTRGEDISNICKEYDMFEGNFTRAILKVNNLLDEWLSLATFCEHPSQIEKIVASKSQLVRDIVMPDSLYLRL